MVDHFQVCPCVLKYLHLLLLPDFTILMFQHIDSFLPLIANFLAEDVGKAEGLDVHEIQALKGYD